MAASTATGNAETNAPERGKNLCGKACCSAPDLIAGASSTVVAASSEADAQTAPHKPGSRKNTAAMLNFFKDCPRMRQIIGISLIWPDIFCCNIDNKMQILPRNP
ncbi:hypothetical protein [Herbaspirillum sp. RV1423]|uniref:hypothetical protein n=1 Tax=Herbaspirillum sp. RV1423 TaxID=1443993 RepID=UPI0012DDE42C|nr:hypothetical protein [Herbaspirillum sp. RV1423]